MKSQNPFNWSESSRATLYEELTRKNEIVKFQGFNEEKKSFFLKRKNRPVLILNPHEFRNVSISENLVYQIESVQLKNKDGETVMEKVISIKLEGVILQAQVRVEKLVSSDGYYITSEEVGGRICGISEEDAKKFLELPYAETHFLKIDFCYNEGHFIYRFETVAKGKKKLVWRSVNYNQKFAEELVQAQSLKYLSRRSSDLKDYESFKNPAEMKSFNPYDKSLFAGVEYILPSDFPLGNRNWAYMARDWETIYLKEI